MKKSKKPEQLSNKGRENIVEVYSKLGFEYVGTMDRETTVHIYDHKEEMDVFIPARIVNDLVQ